METTTVQRETLWQNRNFLKLWTSETISQFGSQFTGLALPTFLIASFGYNPTNLGILQFLGSVPWLLFGLLVGVYVDRHRKQRIMVASNIIRGILLGLIPLTAVLGIVTKLGLAFVYSIAFLVGFFQVFFDVSYQAFLPSLVRRDQLVEGNRRLETSRSTAQVVGPTLAGIVIRIIGPAISVGVDAASFFASALSLGRIGKEGKNDQPLEQGSVRADIKEGLSVVFNDSRLRSIAGCTSTSNFFSSLSGAILVLFFADPPPDGLGYPLLIAALMVGLVFSVGSIGALIGVAISSRAASRLGLGPALIVGTLLGGLGAIPYYFASPTTEKAILSLSGVVITPSILYMMIGTMVIFVGIVVYNVNQVSLRQALVPIRLQGRMNATMRFLVWGTIPLGSLAGGLLATFFGVRAAIGIAVLGGGLAFLWVLLSPIRSLKKIPEPLE